MSIEQTIASLPAGPLALTARTHTALPVAAAGLREEPRARLERLVREHHSFVWRTAQRLGVGASDVDDIVQDVFVLAARKLDDIRHEKGFLFQTCVYVVSHSRRTVQRRREVADDERVQAEVDKRATPEQSVVASELRARLQAILDRMPEELRAVLVLYELERMTTTEIAEMLSLPVGTVSSRLRRAREIFLSRLPRDERGGR